MATELVSTSPPSSPVRGKWFRNQMYQGKLSNNNTGRIFDDFSDSVQYPRIDETQIAWAGRKAQYPWRRSSMPTVEPSFRRCLITTLPNEVLLHIIRFLIPIDQSFHMFVYENDSGRPTTLIHRFCRPRIDNQPVDPISGNTQRDITALATVCRRLSDVYHTVMYGDNRYIFELGLRSECVWPRPTAKSQTGVDDVESWARIYNSSTPCLWPLTHRASFYVKDVTLLITKSYQETNKYERVFLIDQLNQAELILRGSQNLRALTIDMSAKNGPHESVGQRLGWKLEGEDDHVLKLRDVINCSADCRDCPGFETLWELFRAIRCKNEVVLSGHISAELANEMSRAMMIG